MSDDTKERRSTPRFQVKLEAKLIFTPSTKLPKPTLHSTASGLTLVGSTQNLSETGLGLLVSARNIDRYLTANRFNVEIEVKLPSGPIKFTAEHIHHERLIVGKASIGYFIGAEITNISLSDRDSLSSFLKSLPAPKE
jgi:hypothetical protein